MTERVTPDDIVETAVALLERGGLHALAMRRIAAELGVQQSALYWHFDNKQQLLAAVADRVVAAVDVDTGRDWRTRVETLAVRLRAALARYPDGAELVATAVAFRLGGQQPIRRFVDELAQAGLPAADAEVAASVLVHFVLGYTTDEQQHHQAAALGAIDLTAADTDSGPSSDDRFLAGIRLIVAGVGAQAASARPRRAPG